LLPAQKEMVLLVLPRPNSATALRKTHRGTAVRATADHIQIIEYKGQKDRIAGTLQTATYSLLATGRRDPRSGAGSQLGTTS
jgi:hypothetical protein